MGKIKINSKHLPIKVHFFFSMAARGPVMPFVAVYGKQLGTSPVIMGTVNSVLPLLVLMAKPCIGFVVDYFSDFRKSIFIGMSIVMSLAFVTVYLLPSLPGLPIAENETANVTIGCNELIACNSRNISKPEECYGEKGVAICRWHCEDGNNFSTTVIFENRRKKNVSTDALCLVESEENFISCDENQEERTCGLSCKSIDEDRCLYRSLTFWGFVILICFGLTVCYVVGCMNDALCFEILGPGGEMAYGRQRVWGTIGYGTTALFTGYMVDLFSQGQAIKTYAPAFILVCIFTCIDVLCFTKLKLPVISSSKSIAKDVWSLLRMKPVLFFLFFAILAGTFNSFILNYMFWYLEDLAATTGYMEQIKSIEGSIVAAGTLGGEVIFFPLSGKILNTFGYGYSFIFCFICYALRLGLVSLVLNPWWVVPIEFLLHGPTFALSYTIIVAFASVIAPSGTSTTVQGIVASMDDVFGYALGSFIGGVLYKKLGGVTTLRTFSTLAAITSMLYLVLHVMYLKHVMPKTKSPSKESKSSNVKWKSTEKMTGTCDERISLSATSTEPSTDV